MIRNKERNFSRHLEKHFKLTLPEGVEIFYAKGIRVGNGEIKGSGLNGELGYAASDFGFNPTNSFIQNFGHLAKRNIVRLKEEEAKRYAFGADLEMDLGAKSKNVIVTCKGRTLGLGHYDKGRKTILNRIPVKRRRDIVNLMK